MKTANLYAVATVFNGKTPSKSEQRSNGHPILKIKDIDEYGFFRQNYASFVDDAFVRKHSAKIVKQGDTLLLNAAHSASYVGSKLHYCDRETEGSIATGEWTIVRPEQTLLNARYLHHWISSPRARQLVTDLVKGIHLYPKDVARLEIPLPPLEEQKRIAAILDQADALRRLRRRALDRLNTLGHAIFHEMFGDPVLDRAFSESKGAAGWKICRLGDQILLQRGKDITKGEAAVGSVPVISSGGISFYHSKALVPGPGVLLGRKGSVGKVHFSSVDFWPHDTTLFVKDFKGNVPLFVYYFFRQFPISRYEASSANPSLNRNNLHPVEVAWPSIAEQSQFRERIEEVGVLRSPFEKNAIAAQSLFTSLQHRAFRGEL